MLMVLSEIVLESLDASSSGGMGRAVRSTAASCRTPAAINNYKQSAEIRGESLRFTVAQHESALSPSQNFVFILASCHIISN